MKIVIIGGGASGLVSAIYAKNKNNEVIVLERNSRCAKKLLLTGNGKCNYWNSNIDYTNYISDDLDVLKNIITNENKKEALNLFDSLGIIPYIKDGYYYPLSNKSSSITEALILECKLREVEFINDFLVTDIKKEKDKFVIKSNAEEIIADKVIVSTGSKAYPKTGSDGMGYDFASSFNHTIITPLPALTSLIVKRPLKNCKGVRCEVSLKLYEEDDFIKEEYGQMQITDKGISGICTFNLSGIINKGLNKNKKETIYVNFLPSLNLNEKETITFLQNRESKITGRNIEQLLEALLDYHIVKVILKSSNINSNKCFNELNKKEQSLLAKNLISYPLEIVETDSFNHAQVCLGGIKLSEINPKTMQSLKEENLYFTGEILDAAGPCGGYNLAFAFITGMIAGKGVNNA